MRPERFRRICAVLDRRQPDLTVLMERVHKTHNLSAIVRNCDAVGVPEVHVVPSEDGVRLSDDTSASASRWIRMRRHTSMKEAADALKERGFRLVAAHPTPEARTWRSVDFVRPTAIVVGTELDGLSEEALALADEIVAVPMVGMVRSLNVSVATALLLYEAYRQRADAGLYDRRRLPREEYERLRFEWCYPRMAERLREAGSPYPELGEDGRILRDRRDSREADEPPLPV